MQYRHGFGLIALLMTIAIIAVLSGIILKAYYGNKTPAQEVRQGIDAIDAARAAKDASDQRTYQLQQELSN